MEDIVNQFNTLIVQLRTENEALRLKSAKDEILAKNRLESIRIANEEIQRLKADYDRIVTDLAAISRERDDALILIDSTYTERNEARKSEIFIEDLQEKLYREQRLNSNLEDIIASTRFCVLSARHLPARSSIGNGSVARSSKSIATQTETTGPLLVEKYAQTFDGVTELKYIFRE